MREIKFRAWNKIRGEWLDKELMPIIPIDETGKILQLYNNDYVVWSQYTGLKDKNGVEIYEGDILKTYYSSGCSECGHGKRQMYAEVVFEGTKFCTKGHPQDLSSELGYNNYPDSQDEYIVVGNIYENPELLE